MQETKTVTMKVPVAMNKRIEREMKKEGRNKTQFILRVLDFYISEQESRRKFGPQ